MGEVALETGTVIHRQELAAFCRTLSEQIRQGHLSPQPVRIPLPTRCHTQAKLRMKSSGKRQFTFSLAWQGVGR
jgi:hypothetical protein